MHSCTRWAGPTSNWNDRFEAGAQAMNLLTELPRRTVVRKDRVASVPMLPVCSQS